MTRGKKVALTLGIGCIGVPILLGLVVGAIALAGQLMYGDDPPAKAELSKLAIPLDRLPGASQAEESRGPVTPGRDLPELPPAYSRENPVHLDIELEEGDFTIQAGEPGSALRAEGEFDPRDYELVQEAREGENGPEVTIRFRRKASLLAILFHGEGDNHNKITITIPKGLPTSVGLHVRRGESHADLGGLTITDLDVDVSMGDHLVKFSEPVDGTMRRADFRGSMGDIKMLELGNAHAEEVTIGASMGDMRVDFGGDWPEAFHSKATMKFRMGDTRVTVPENVRISEGSSTNVTFADSNMKALKSDAGAGPSSPSLEMHLSMMLGDISVHRH